MIKKHNNLFSLYTCITNPLSPSMFQYNAIILSEIRCVDQTESIIINVEKLGLHIK
jgi:hypothetical protein